MKTLMISVLLSGVLTACGQSAPPADGGVAPAPEAPAPKANPLALGGEITLTILPGATLLAPDAAEWTEVEAYEIALTMAPPVHPSVNLRYDASAAPLPVVLQAASDGDVLYLRMRWSDTSANTQTGRTDFADGAAVQFSLGDEEQTSFMMGAPQTPVNIWYWRADGSPAQNLAAGGFGSTTHLPQGELQASATYLESGEWVVVFSRPLTAQGDYQVQLNGLPVQLGLAAWQGAQAQRDGLKYVTMGWLNLDPGA